MSDLERRALEERIEALESAIETARQDLRSAIAEYISGTPEISKLYTKIVSASDTLVEVMSSI